MNVRRVNRENEVKKSSRRVKLNIPAYMNVIIICLLFLSGYWAYQSNSNAALTIRSMGSTLFNSEAAKKAKIKKEINVIFSECNDKNRRAYKEFLSNLNAGDNYFNRASRNVDSTVNSLTSFSACKDICWKMIQDKIHSSHTTDSFINSKVYNGVGRDCINGDKKLRSAYGVFEQKLKENATDANRKLCQFADKLGNEAEISVEPLKEFEKQLALSNQAIQEINSATGMGVGGISTVVLSRAAGNAIWSVLGGVLRRFLVKIGLASWLTEGGPVGIAIEAIIDSAFVVWDGYQIYKAQGKLKSELKSKLHHAVNNYRNRSIANVRSHAEKLLEKYNSSIAMQNKKLTETVDKSKIN